MTPLKAAIIIRLLSDKTNRDPRFLEYVTAKITRGKSQKKQTL